MGTPVALDTASQYSFSWLRSWLAHGSMPISFRFTSIWSIWVLPTRSPMPQAVACTTSAPATNAAIAFATASPRSQCPCHSTRTSCPEGFTTSLITKCSRATVPIGVACPAVSQITMACAPQRMAFEYSRWMVSRIAACGVLGDIHDLQTLGHGELYRMFRGAQQEVVGPIFGVASDRARPDESSRLDGNAGALDEFRNRPDVVFVGARGAIRLDLQPGTADLPRQRLAVRQRARAGPRQTDVQHIDADRFHQVEDLDLLVDGGIVDGGRLQSVAQRLVVKQNPARGLHGSRIDLVPVVNQFRNFC